MLANSMRLRIINRDIEKPILPGVAQSDLQEWKDTVGNLIALGYSAGGYHWMDWPDLATFRFDENLNTCAYPVEKSNLAQVTDQFYRNVFPLALQSRGIEVLHASAVLAHKGVVAFCADSGTGKSTLAFGLAQRGYRLWADDAVVINSIGEKFFTYAIPFFIRLQRDSRTYFNYNKNRVEETFQAGDDDIIQTAPLLAVCLLKREPREDSWISTIKPSDAFIRILAQAYYYQIPDPHHKRAMINNYLQLVEYVPVYQVNFRDGFQHLATLIDRLDEMINEF